MTESLDPEVCKRLLLERKEELRRLADSAKQSTEVVELDQTRVGRVSRMDALQVQAMSQECNRRRQIELRRIEAALMRIANDDYGFCNECGEMIALKRLEIDPTALLCIDCASRLEEH